MDQTEPKFPESRLIEELEAWWRNEVEGAATRDPFSEPDSQSQAGTIFDVVPAIDSQSVVAALQTVEDCLGCEIPPNIIRPGGYQSFGDMIDDLIPKLRTIAVKG